MPVISHFAFVKGEDVQIDWTIRTEDSVTAPVVDITGWTLSFKVKRSERDADPSLVTGTTTLVTPASGTAQTAIPSTEMATLYGDYKYALWRTNAGAKTCLAKGRFSVSDSVQD